MKEIEDLNKLFYGNEAGEKIKKFKDGLIEIEDKYFEYFNSRTPKNEFDKIDKLHNHYMTNTDLNGITFKFLSDSDLDENIRIECEDLFKKIFNK